MAPPDISKCPHCEATLYGAMISACSKCGKPVDVRARTEKAYDDRREAARMKREQNPLRRLWMNLRYGSFKNACRQGRGHFVETESAGVSKEVIGGQLAAKMFNHFKLSVSKVTDGAAAWDEFWKPRVYPLHHIAFLKCSHCGHVYAISSPVPTGLSDEYLGSFKGPWFQIFSSQFRAAYGASTLVCLNCGQRTPGE